MRTPPPIRRVAVALCLALVPAVVAAPATRPVRVIFDTDMMTDCDDAGALAVLHVLADRGECEILATVVSVANPWAAACTDAINTYYGRDDLADVNPNFSRDAVAAHFVVPRWPGAVVFVGREVASVPSGVKVGANLAKTPMTNPVRLAYRLYHNGADRDRHVADPASVLFAVRGPRDCWDLSAPGAMDLGPDAKFQWRYDAAGRQRFLRKKIVDGKPNNAHVERTLDELMTQAPRTTAKDGR